jgi:hypothetical protein
MVSLPQPHSISLRYVIALRNAINYVARMDVKIGKSHSVSFYYDNTAETAVAKTGEFVTWDEVPATRNRFILLSFI